jgi:hypothetical protein
MALLDLVWGDGWHFEGLVGCFCAVDGGFQILVYWWALFGFAFGRKLTKHGRKDIRALLIEGRIPDGTEVRTESSIELCLGN